MSSALTPKNVKVLSAADAVTAAPSSATDGFEIPSFWGADDAKIFVKNSAGTAGSGLSATLRAWGYDPVLDDWQNMGLLNSESSIDEIDTSGDGSADAINHAEPIVGLHGLSRFALQVTAIAGTSTAIDAWLTRGQIPSGGA